MQSKEIAIIGYSGHSYVCIEIALLNGFNITGYYDLNKKKLNPFDLDYLGKEEESNLNNSVFITIADNKIRKKIYENNSTLNFNNLLIHPKSIISKKVELKNQTLVCAGSIINPKVQIGVGSIINTGSIIEHECSIGDFSHIAPGAVLCGGVKVGNESFVGANCVVKQGIKIGNNVIIGAGSVVIDDVEDNFVVAGNPCKKI